MAFALGVTNATAGWIFVSDRNTQATATNPGSPKNQSAGSVAAYAQDLLDLEGPLSLIVSDDNYSGAPLHGLGNPTSSSMYVLAFHFGHGNSYWPHTGNSFDVFYNCRAECYNFTLLSTEAVGSYRLYDPPGPSAVAASIPEPGSLALLGAGLAGLVVYRRKRT